MRGADDTDRDGIDDGSAATGDQLVQSIAIPRRARDINKRAALRRCFEVTLARGYERGRKLRNVQQSRTFTRRGGPVRMR